MRGRICAFMGLTRMSGEFNVGFPVLTVSKGVMWYFSQNLVCPLLFSVNSICTVSHLHKSYKNKTSWLAYFLKKSMLPVEKHNTLKFIFGIIEVF